MTPLAGVIIGYLLGQQSRIAPPPLLKILQTCDKHQQRRGRLLYESRFDVLSEFSEPGNSVCENLLNAVTLDNVSELISAAFRRGC
jgi:hypothetical protein